MNYNTTVLNSEEKPCSKKDGKSWKFEFKNLNLVHLFLYFQTLHKVDV